MFQHLRGWLSASTFLASCQSVMTTEAMLMALNEFSGIPGSQTWHFVGKDVLGQLGGLLVMSGLTKQVDTHPRKLLSVSHLLEQTSMNLLLFTPTAPMYCFMPMAAAANMCVNVSFIVYGSVNAKCIQAVSQSPQPASSNVGELYSKLAVSQTLASTLGLTVGMITNMSSLSHHWSGWVAFFALGVGRVVCFQNAIKKIL